MNGMAEIGPSHSHVKIRLPQMATIAYAVRPIKPLTLEAKEAISLINGTQAMLAVGALALLSAETLAASADVIGALTVDAEGAPRAGRWRS